MQPRVEILSSSSDDDSPPPPRRPLDEEPLSRPPPHARQDDDPVVGGRRRAAVKVAVPPELQPGVRVRIRGLVNAREFNGYESVVLEPTEAERRDNEEKGRVLVAKPLVGMTPPSPKQTHLALKPENLVVLPGDRSVDWRLGSDGGTVLELVHSMMTASGLVPSKKDCGDFAIQFRQHMCWESIAKMPAPFAFTHEGFRTRLRDQGAHNVHFINMEQIGHSLVLETFQGCARVYQACQGEYTAVAWLKGLDCRACARWGAGRQLQYSELNEFVNLLFRVQALAVEVASIMFDQVPQDWKDKDNVAASDVKRLGKFQPLPLMKLGKRVRDCVTAFAS